MTLFGPAPIESGELARILLTEVPIEAGQQMAGGLKEYRGWTQAVKQVLTKHGAGFDVCCSGIEGSNEWLLDLVWWRHDPQQGLGIALACESEWSGSPTDVSDDFRKLLCVKAPLKLLVYGGGPTPQYGEGIRARVKADLEAYLNHVAGEEYLFVSLDVGGGYAHRFVVPNDGRISNIIFDLLDSAKRTTA